MRLVGDEKLVSAVGAIIATLGTLPLLRLSLPASSDGLFHLYRSWELARLWEGGVFVPRWAPDFYFGYGYPIFLYTPSLPYALVDLVHALGLTWPGAFRVVLAISLPLMALATYPFARAILSPSSALAASVANALVPYHLVNLYGRGDLSELLAAIWFPLILWSLIRLARGGSWQVSLALAFSTAGLLLTHNLSVVMFAPLPFALFVALVVAAVRGKAGAQHKSRPSIFVAKVAAGTAIGLGLSAFFWLPAFTERSSAQFSRLLHSYGYAAHFAGVRELLSLDVIQHYPPVFSFADGFGYQFGLWQSVSLIGAVAATAVVWRRLDATQRIVLAGSPLVCLLSLGMATAWSSAVWDHAPFLGLAQFPWRFLGIAALPSALSAGIVAEAVTIRWRPIIIGATVAIVAGSSLLGLRPIDLRLAADDFSVAGYVRFEGQERLVGTSAAAEYLPATVKVRAETSPWSFGVTTGQSAPIGPGLPITRSSTRNDTRVYLVELGTEGTVTLDTLDLAGMSAQLDGHDTPIAVDDVTGLVKVAVGAGRHTIEVSPHETRSRIVADVISLATFASVVIALAAWSWRRGSSGRAPDALPFVCAQVPTVIILIAVGVHHDGSPAFGGVVGRGGARIMSAAVAGEVGGYIRVLAPSVLDVVTHESLPATAQPVKPFARLTASDGITWGQVEGPAIVPGQDILLHLALPVPPGTPSGVYTLETGFTDSSTGDATPILPLLDIATISLLPLSSVAPLASVVIVNDSTETLPGKVASFDRAVDVGAPTFASRPGGVDALARPRVPSSCMVTANIGEALCLAAGDVLEARIPWSDAGAAGHRFSASLHLVDDSGTLWAATDSEPAAGRFPASFWHPGQLVLDTMALPIPSYVPSGRYRLALMASLDGRTVGAVDSKGVSLGGGATIATVDLSPATHDVEFVTVDSPVPPMPHRDASLGLTLRGAATGPDRVLPGQAIQVHSLWASHVERIGDLICTVVLKGADGGVFPLLDSAPSPSYPTSRWPQNVGVLAQWSARIPPDARAGTYQVVANVHSAQATGPSLVLGSVLVTESPPVQAVHPAQTTTALFGGLMRLLGLDPALPATITTGSKHKITLYWQAERPLDAAYSVSVQLLDLSGKLAAQDDRQPGGAEQPTSVWMPNHPYVDPHEIDTSKLASGTYSIIVVVYNSTSGARLRPDTGGDSFKLGNVELNS